jgi:hypothetical protein
MGMADWRSRGCSATSYAPQSCSSSYHHRLLWESAKSHHRIYDQHCSLFGSRRSFVMENTLWGRGRCICIPSRSTEDYERAALGSGRFESDAAPSADDSDVRRKTRRKSPAKGSSRLLTGPRGIYRPARLGMNWKIAATNVIFPRCFVLASSPSGLSHQSGRGAVTGRTQPQLSSALLLLVALRRRSSRGAGRNLRHSR